MIVLAVFQQLEVDYIIGHPNRDVQVTDLTEVPIIRMYGVTESGMQAICDCLHGVLSAGQWLNCQPVMYFET